MRPCLTHPLRIRGAEFGGPKPLFCVPLVARDLQQLLARAQVAHRLQADVIEWRADSHEESGTESILEAASQLRTVLDHEPILFTLRISSEGGAKNISQDVRTDCIDTIIRSGLIDLVDVE